ncbi:MAG: hypothetical protein A2Y57_03575 [Candidatus Woykebacteria bacterium RBG_13_40_7b]|uniref:Zinc finger DksA/TraR C4-type domain-containing protein n=1 Tax=Candidatus Woykebacteria bacterium RBG_13_40_7b TaxID=1802594 RepID=A0A1G1W815_9BACT|nr:MAG: hypothetical protein A2Y57_03575 [Candidatus Woykebacteria bacterium RBG_13_40_7b]
MNIKELQSSLDKSKISLQEQLKYLKSEDPFLSADRDLSNTLEEDASEIEGHDRLLAQEIPMREKLIKVEGALDRIKKGTYGKCLKCGRQIDEERLEIVPEASYCVEHEKTNHKKGGDLA